MVGFIVLVPVCLAAILLQQQIAEIKREQAARAAFYAQMPASVYIPPLLIFLAVNDLSMR